MNPYTIDPVLDPQKALEEKQEKTAFRTFLENSDMPSSEIDRIVVETYDAFAGVVDCAECANRCILDQPALTQQDIARFTEGLQLSPAEFAETHLIPCNGEPGKYRFKVQPCPFFTSHLCTNFAARPCDCCSSANLNGDDSSAPVWPIIFNYELCPVVYLVYEKLKQELWQANSFK